MRSHDPADLLDPRFHPSKWAQFYCDASRDRAERYRAHLETAIDRLDGREDNAAIWARAFIVQERIRIDGLLKRQSSAAAALEKARDELATRHKELAAADRAHRDALTVEDLTEASAVLEIARRRAGIAEEAFKGAAKAAHLPSSELRFENTMRVVNAEGVAERMARAASRSDGWFVYRDQPGYANAIEAYLSTPEWSPERMAFEVVSETPFRADPDVSEAFDFRFTRWARSQGIELAAE
jgi:hypothetical protein